ncbi:MAG: Hpt domain-containing protein [Alphaproteobacteria bacterium]
MGAPVLKGDDDVGAEDVADVADVASPLHKYRQGYLLECGQLLTGLRYGLNTLDAGTATGDTLVRASRAAHSIRGGAGAFGLVNLEEAAATLEMILEPLLELDPAAVTTETVAALRQASAAVDEALRAARGASPRPPPEDNGGDHLEQALSGPEPARAAPGTAPQKPGEPLDGWWTGPVLDQPSLWEIVWEALCSLWSRIAARKGTAAGHGRPPRDGDDWLLDL